MTSPSGSPLLRGLTLGMQISIAMTLPLVVLGLAGRWLDRTLGTFPWFFLSGFLVALLLGLAAVARIVRRVVSE